MSETITISDPELAKMFEESGAPSLKRDARPSQVLKERTR